MNNLSNVFKFTQGLGQKGHQIGRKVGDAIELLVLGMIHKNPELAKYLVVEDGVEGASGAKHKVEFSFYNLNSFNKPSKLSSDLFGIIECKKVGVEQTVKGNFKIWEGKTCNKGRYCETEGYSFSISPNDIKKKWNVHVKAKNEPDETNLELIIKETLGYGKINTITSVFNCAENCQILIVLDIDNILHILAPDQKLSDIPQSIKKCFIIKIKKLDDDGLITSINVNQSLPGPQTPEKAKQASFVSLDVRKKVSGSFDKLEHKTFNSILVIGEASHWENKSRSMIRLYNDYNLIVPDEVLIYFFEEFERELGTADYQTYMTKTKFETNEAVRGLVFNIINHFEKRIVKDMETDDFVQFTHEVINGTNRLLIMNL